MRFLSVIFLLIIFPKANLNASGNDSLIYHLADSLIPELNQEVSYSISGLALKDFLALISKNTGISMHINQSLEIPVYNHFEEESLKDILLFISEEYNLKYQNWGKIITVNKVELDEKWHYRNINLEYDSLEDSIQLDVRGDSLHKVLKSLSKISGLSLMASNQCRDKLIHIYIQKMALEAALKILARSSGLSVNTIESTNSFYYDIPANDEYRFERFQNSERIKINIDDNGDTLIVAHLLNSPVLNSILQVQKYFDYNHAFLDDIQWNKTIISNDLNHDQFLYQLLNGSEYSYIKENGVYVFGRKENLRNRMTEIVKIENSTIEHILEAIGEHYSGNAKYQVSRGLNGILITGLPQEIQELKSIINQLDVQIPMLELEVLIVDYKKGHGIKTGISAGVSDSIKSGGQLLPGIDFVLNSADLQNTGDYLNDNSIINIGRVKPNFYAQLQALEENDLINIRSTPRLATLNGHEANLTIGQTAYYLEQTQNIQGANNLVTTVTPQYREINADMSITIYPQISANDFVTLDINVEMADFTPPLVVNGPPGKSKRKFTSMVRVKNEEMLILGGLEENSESKSNNGIPLLSRIPVLKWLFAQNRKSKSESRMLIFIRPRIRYR